MSWDALNKIDRSRFESTNLMTFSPTWADIQVEWWAKKVFAVHGLYPDDLAELLSASAKEPKSFTLSDLDVARDSFVIKVEGRRGESGEFWWHQRSLDLRGRFFEAQRMAIPDAEQGRGKGRLLMADLIYTARRLDIKRINIEAQSLGRYAWARLGFVPDKGSWNYHVRVEARRRLAMARAEIGEQRYRYCDDVLGHENPETIREVVSWTDDVESFTSRYDEDGLPMRTTLGRALVMEVQADWFGSFDLDDPESVSIFEAYVGRLG